MATPAGAWPADPAAMAAGARFLADAARAPRVAIAADRDVDGLAAGVLLARALRGLGAPEVAVLAAGKGEHAHTDAMRARIRAARPAALVIVDMGSRGEPILPGLPTLLVDHHQPRGFPPGAVVVSAHGHEPVAPASWLAWHLAARVVDAGPLDWLALLGTVADLGVRAALPGVREALARHPRRALTEAVALLNAARRCDTADAETALAALEAAESVADIVEGRVPGADALRACRRRVRAEVERCARTRPRFLGRVALLRFASPVQVHPLVAVRWARRLAGAVVMAANDGYLPGRVNFAMRTTAAVNLVDLLRSLPLPPGEGEYGFGHPRATGGSLPPERFEALLAALAAATARCVAS